jgi:hypothetical protein
MGKTRRVVVEKQGAEAPVIGVDCDLTLVDENENLIPGAKEALIYLKSTGWKIIIWTHRSDLAQTRNLLERHGIPFDHINEDPDTDAKDYSRKIFFNATVDDKAVAFDGDWQKTIAELDRRRSMWKIDGETKSSVKLMVADREGKVAPIAIFDFENGLVVERMGSKSSIVGDILKNGVELDDRIVRPDEGRDFLKALLGLQGTYLWAEAA